jgi:hypothetical protein
VAEGEVFMNFNRSSNCGDGKGGQVTGKRVVKVTKRKTRKAVVSDLDDAAAMAVIESRRLVTKRVDPEMRRQLVAAEAYFLAERRGFCDGSAVEDWVAAEVVVDSLLKQQAA